MDPSPPVPVVTEIADGAPDAGSAWRDPSPGGRRRLVRIERHRLGPRLYVLGLRIHECWTGIALLAAAGALALTGVTHPFHVRAGLALLGAWMVAKDWRDLVPRLRDTAAWSIGPHRPRFALREVRRAAWLPTAIAVLVAAVALADIASALTPSLAGRVEIVRRVLPHGIVPVSHALAVTAGVGLLVVAAGLARRRRRAFELAAVLLVALMLLNLAKGLDVEEAAAGALLVGLLVWGREAFYVQPQPGALGRGLVLVPAVLGGTWGVAALTVWAARDSAAPPVTWSRALGGSALLLTHAGSPFRFGERFEWVPLALGLLGLAAVILCSELAFRPLLAPSRPPDDATRRAAGALVAAHGQDTLSFFKLRGDLHYLFDSAGTALVGYRTVGRNLMVSGDPVGPPRALPGLLRDLFAFAESRGMRVVVVGASRTLVDLHRQAGLRAVYMGDEAIVETAGFTLEGRGIRKVRQSVTRLVKAGYSTEVRDVAALATPELRHLQSLSTTWRTGGRERGFSMAMDRLADEHGIGGCVIVARDGDGRPRGLLHFVPCPGRPAMSLSLMRRDEGTPNGLTEFMVVRAIESLRDLGIREVSLNFAAFARILHSPRSRRERALATLLRVANPHFQIESLYRFNAKFCPRWDARYLLYEGRLGLVRAGLATLRVEGQLPSPSWPGRRTAPRT